VGNDLEFGYSGGFFAWLVGIAIAIAVLVWVFWIAVIGVVCVVLWIALDQAWLAWRRRRQPPARA